jgi:hypothetical protein
MQALERLHLCMVAQGEKQHLHLTYLMGPKHALNKVPQLELRCDLLTFGQKMVPSTNNRGCSNSSTGVRPPQIRSRSRAHDRSVRCTHQMVRSHLHRVAA